MNETIRDFMDYAGRESILPPGTEPSEYRKRFEAAYPFQPEVIDVLLSAVGQLPEFSTDTGCVEAPVACDRFPQREGDSLYQSGRF